MSRSTYAIMVCAGLAQGCAEMAPGSPDGGLSAYQPGIAVKRDLQIQAYATLPAPGAQGRLAVATGTQSRGLKVDHGVAWQHVGDHVFDVRAFGAIPGDFGDDTAAIQAAVDAAAASPTGGVVYLPPGEYKVSGAARIVLPRSSTRPIALIGAGQNVSRIQGELGAPTPLVTFDDTDVASSHFVFSDLTLARKDGGDLIRYSPPSGSVQPLRYALFENLVLTGPGSSGHVPPVTPPPEGSMLYLTRAESSVIRNVTVFEGGRYGIRLEDCSDMELFRVTATDADYQSVYGIYVLRGSGYTMTTIQTSATELGQGLTLDGTSAITITQFMSEGKRSHADIKLIDAVDVVINQAGLGAPSNGSPPDYAYGIHATGATRNVRVTSASSGNFYFGPLLPFKAIKVDATVKNFVVDGYAFFGGIPAENIEIDSDAENVVIKSTYQAGLSAEHILTRRIIPGRTIAGGAVSAAGAATVKVSGAGTLSAISGGHEGQELVLIFVNNPTVTSTGNLRLTSNFPATANDTLTLVYSGSLWYEKSRRVL